MTATHSEPRKAIGVGDEVEPATPHRSPGTPITRAFSRLPQWAAPLAVGAAALGSCVYVGLVDPNTTGSAFYPQCAFKALTGFDCPGCGLTRAVHALVTGHPMRAIDHNILIVLLAPLAIYTYFVWLSRSVFGWELPYVKVPKQAAYAIGPLILTFWVVRNIPVGPFRYLNATAAGA